MNIIWHGQSCFSIKSKDKLIVIDPFDKKTGLKQPRLKADILLISHDHPDHADTSIVKKAHDDLKIISEPGEYEFGGVYIQAIPAYHDDKDGKERGETLMFTLRSEDMVVAHLGDLGQTELTEEQLEELNGVDILLVPVGGEYTINGNQAAKIVTQVDPRIVIPMHYNIAGLKVKIGDASSFLAEEGAKEVEPKDELKIEKRNLPVEEREAVVLKPKTG
ncbi:MAG: MBL fold metallo-hydrolase [Candidatus Berkelbacteria bacterium]|nr:MBL fold metallo-hydrolase [Candidatus Berkelbacteria bacterium]